MKSENLNRNPSFLLAKWYLDCVSENGDVAIVYVAHLRWNKLSVHYASLLTARNGHVAFVSSLRKCLLPQPERDTTTLSLPHLGIEGTWQGLRTPVQRSVFCSQEGSVNWHCHQPMSQVDLLLPGATRIAGVGYAECLTLSVLPWKLPLEELHWGRFLSGQHAIVWIDWRGPHKWCTVIHNGEEREVASLTESGMRFAETGTVLDLDRGLVLRGGKLGQTVFAGVSRLSRLLPRNFLSVEEHKWRSRAVLRTGNVTAPGWAIHEVVKWR